MRTGSAVVGFALIVLCVACGDNTKTVGALESSTPSTTASITSSPEASSPGPETSAPASSPEVTKGPAPTPIPVTPAATSSYTEASGISGVVQAGPTCPVERADSPCPDRPVSGTNVSVKGSGFSSNTTTNGQGRFSVKAPPGTYTVHASSQFGCQDETVTVTSHHYTHVTITCDTGIR